MSETQLKFDDRGLIPCVVQQYDTGDVLMVAWMNAESIELTKQTGTTWFWSRSRQELWNKGATSGGSYIYYCPKGLTFCAFVADTDRTGGVIFGPVVLGEPQDLLLDAEGPACHTGNTTCFFRTLD